jgi:hypothetical protein
MWSLLLGKVADIGSNWLKRRQDIAEAKVKAKVAKIEAEVEAHKTQQVANNDADLVSLKAMERSWKDEFLLILFSIPVIMAFIPEMQKYVFNGFDAINNMPDWYIYLYAGMIITIYGLRGLAQQMFAVFIKKGTK